MPKKLYDKDNLLSICFKLFSQNGYSKTSTAMIAEKAGISKALLFHHFKNKKIMYISVLEQIFDKMATEVPDESFSKYTDYFEARSDSGHNKLNYLRNNPAINKILLEAFQFTPDELKADIHDFTLRIKSKYGYKEKDKELRMFQLFNELELKDGIDRKNAFELINIVTEHFRKKIAIDLTDEKKLYDDAYWKHFFTKRELFLNMLRYGIQTEKKENK